MQQQQERNNEYQIKADGCVRKTKRASLLSLAKLHSQNEEARWDGAFLLLRLLISLFSSFLSLSPAPSCALDFLRCGHVNQK